MHIEMKFHEICTVLDSQTNVLTVFRIVI